MTEQNCAYCIYWNTECFFMFEKLVNKDNKGRNCEQYIKAAGTLLKDVRKGYGYIDRRDYQ